MKPGGLLLFWLILLAGCAKPVPVLLPQISLPPAMVLDTCQWSMPRLQDQWSIILDKQWKGKACKVYPVELWEDRKFQKQCLQHPVNIDSNVVIGFDQKNLDCYNANMEKIHQTLKLYREKIESINQQRHELFLKSN